ncbi:MAG: hypothetical protein AAGC72_00430 [Planctomycetota bacterium]
MSANNNDKFESGYGVMYQGAKEGHQYGTEAIAVLVFVYRTLQGLVNLYAYPWLIILRHDFGERFLSGWVLFFCSMVMAVVSTFMGSGFGYLVAASLPFFWAVHKKQIKKRNKQGIAWHSKNNGVSRINQVFPNLSYSRVDQVLEPLLLAGSGFVLVALGYLIQGTVHNSFGLVMVLGGICLHLHHGDNYRKHRDLLLDQIDSQIVSENFAEALKGDSTAYQTDGFVVQGADQWTDKERQLITEAVLGESAEHVPNDSNVLSPSNHERSIVIVTP